ncbi:MAG TPA: S53 family peptidase [Ktedonosporobacter sp.]|nr:S53 family peptidase [Ktedonosporobacter sp.]
MILLGAIFGSLMLRDQAANAHPSRQNAGMQGMPTGITPMQPMPGMAAKMGNNGAMGPLPCLNSAAPPLCYSPQQLRQAYGVTALLNAGITGKGRIITIIDAFQSPTIRTDLQLFDKVFGLKDPQLNIITPFGLTPFNAKDPNQTGFAGEISLDVEWAHAMAPDATIDLVLANVKNETIQGQLSALLQAINFAVVNNMGSVISMSFGVGETCLSMNFIHNAHQTFKKARAQHQTLFASAGDSGAAVIQCQNGQPVTLDQGSNFPASDPLVTSVGGTKLLASPAGNYMSEMAWNESQRGAGATGGGVSKIFPQPAFQKNIIQSNTRAISDIAIDADPLTGVPVVTSSLKPGQTLIIPVGGTSIGAPVAAGMVALLDQAAGGKRLGFLNSGLYRLSQNTTAYGKAFHDVKTGNNTFVFQAGNGQVVTIPGFKAVAGWDPPTGLGSPDTFNMSKLLPQFIKADDGADL